MLNNKQAGFIIHFFLKYESKWCTNKNINLIDSFVIIREKHPTWLNHKDKNQCITATTIKCDSTKCTAIYYNLYYFLLFFTFSFHVNLINDWSDISSTPRPCEELWVSLAFGWQQEEILQRGDHDAGRMGSWDSPPPSLLMQEWGGRREEGVRDGLAHPPPSLFPVSLSLYVSLSLSGILVHYCSLFTSLSVISLSAAADSISHSPTSPLHPHPSTHQPPNTLFPWSLTRTLPESAAARCAH